MIPSSSHQVPNGFFVCSQCSQQHHIFSYMFWPQLPLFVNHIGSPKGKTALCLFWEWQKFAHHNIYITRPCGQAFILGVCQTKGFFFLEGDDGPIKEVHCQNNRHSIEKKKRLRFRVQGYMGVPTKIGFFFWVLR